MLNGDPAAEHAGRAHRPRPVPRRLAGRREGAGLPGGGGHPGRLPTTETYAAIRLDIDNRRWAGVPFYLRTGKRLARRVTEIARGVQAGAAPAVRRDRHRGARPERAGAAGPARRGRHAAVRVQGAGHARWRSARSPWTSRYGGSFTEASPEAYERLILDVLLGDPSLFPRHDEVELSWQILDPIVEYWAGTRATARRTAGLLGAGRGRRDAGP